MLWDLAQLKLGATVAAPHGPCVQLWRTQLPSHLISNFLRTGRFHHLAESCGRTGSSFFLGGGWCQGAAPCCLAFPIPALPSTAEQAAQQILPRSSPSAPVGPAHPMPSTPHAPALLCKKLPGIHIRSPFELLMLHSLLHLIK